MEEAGPVLDVEDRRVEQAIQLPVEIRVLPAGGEGSDGARVGVEPQTEHIRNPGPGQG